MKKLFHSDFLLTSRSLTVGMILIQHEIRLTMRQPFSWATPLLFFFITACLFSFALGHEKNILQHAAGGVIWVVALLATLISMETLFRHDAEEGYLDLLLLSSQGLVFLVLCKIISHWITHCFPFIIMSPLIGLLFNLSLQEEMALFLSLFLGTPILCLLGAIGAALVVGIGHRGLLLPVLIMPLYVPVLICGTSLLTAASLHQSLSGYIAILGAFLLFSLAFAPLMTSMALRIGVDS